MARPTALEAFALGKRDFYKQKPNINRLRWPAPVQSAYWAGWRQAKRERKRQ